MPKSKFHIGQGVCHRSFVDCFGKHHDAVSGLHVAEIERVEPVSIPTWFRITAIGENGFGYVKAAESFFDAADPEQTLTGMEPAAA
jgi:hypothetical protein